MDPISIVAATIIAFGALGTGPSDAQQGPAWLACETVDKGGYSVFADPTCPGFDKSNGDANREAYEAAPVDTGGSGDANL
jgi:hypothetical protein